MDDEWHVDAKTAAARRAAEAQPKVMVLKRRDPDAVSDVSAKVQDVPMSLAEKEAAYNARRAELFGQDRSASSRKPARPGGKGADGTRSQREDRSYGAGDFGRGVPTGGYGNSWEKGRGTGGRKGGGARTDGGKGKGGPVGKGKDGYRGKGSEASWTRGDAFGSSGAQTDGSRQGARPAGSRKGPLRELSDSDDDDYNRNIAYTVPQEFPRATYNDSSPLAQSSSNPPPSKVSESYQETFPSLGNRR
mmetsp:Transcript_93560/g.213944  ORF Transcript_93560/g.213944 Transcript_93560/m.213944 type:complete len:247 (+) Transcript_93560:37-777(+)